MYLKVLPTILSNLKMTQCNSSGEKRKKKKKKTEKGEKMNYLNSADQWRCFVANLVNMLINIMQNQIADSKSNVISEYFMILLALCSAQSGKYFIWSQI